MCPGSALNPINSNVTMESWKDQQALSSQMASVLYKKTMLRAKPLPSVRAPSPSAFAVRAKHSPIM